MIIEKIKKPPREVKEGDKIFVILPRHKCHPDYQEGIKVKPIVLQNGDKSTYGYIELIINKILPRERFDGAPSAKWALICQDKICNPDIKFTVTDEDEFFTEYSELTLAIVRKEQEEYEDENDDDDEDETVDPEQIKKLTELAEKLTNMSNSLFGAFKFDDKALDEVIEKLKRKL